MQCYFLVKAMEHFLKEGDGKQPYALAHSVSYKVKKDKSFLFKLCVYTTVLKLIHRGHIPYLILG